MTNKNGEPIVYFSEVFATVNRDPSLVTYLGYKWLQNSIWQGEIYEDEAIGSDLLSLCIVKINPLNPDSPPALSCWCSNDKKDLTELLESDTFPFQSQQLLLGSRIVACRKIAWNYLASYLENQQLAVPIEAEATISYLKDPMYLIPHETSGKYVIKQLDQSHMSFVMDNWKFQGYPDTLDRLCLSASHGMAVGAFEKEKGESLDKRSPVSWAVVFREGCIACLGTSEKHRRKGLAAAVCFKLSEIIIKKGFVPYCFVESCDTSSVSMSLFAKLGFTASNEIMRWGTILKA